MHALRHAKTIARLVLAWFCLYVVLGVASTAVAGGSTQVVCSAHGVVKLIGAGEAPGGEQPSHKAQPGHCPICACTPPVVEQSNGAPAALAQLLPAPPEAPQPAVPPTTQPARGPPAHLT